MPNMCSRETNRKKAEIEAAIDLFGSPDTLTLRKTTTEDNRRGSIARITLALKGIGIEHSESEQAVEMKAILLEKLQKKLAIMKAL